MLPATGRYFSFSLKAASPTSVYVALVAAILSIVKHCSASTITWFLKSQQDFLHLVLRRSTTLSDQLAHHESSLIQEIPHSIDTIVQWLELDPVLTSVVSCRECFAMYPILPDTPRQCIHELLPSSTSLDPLKKKVNTASPDPTALESTVCGAPLFKNRGINQVPIQKYGFQSLQDWIARLFSRPHIEEALEQTATRSRIPFNPADTVKDIHDSRAWKQFSGPDGKQFTGSSHNLTFCLYTDAINAFGNRQAGKHASITFLILICLSLPLELRFRPEYIFIAGIAPGPKEPSLEQTNWILRPLVQQLNLLWNPGLHLSRTHQHSGGRRIFGALFTFLGDLPAVRRALGFSSTSSTHLCSYCLLTKDKITNFDSKSWPRRNTPDHRKWACNSRDAKSIKEKEEIFNDHGVRYSALLELQYWDIVSLHCVDSMHNLLLGLLSWHCKRLWAMEDVPKAPEPEGVSTRELMDLLMDAAQPQPHPTAFEPNTAESQFQLGLSLLFDDDNVDARGSPSVVDEDFSPSHDDEGWNNDWTTLSDGEITLDSEALAFINAFLPCINAPSWIKQLLPILGKASHGRLKADEWRNLFTIQLPLILPLYWQGQDAQNLSLLHNFAHLVSLVNLGLMREMDSATIAQYRHHLTSYLEISVKLFGPLVAPNHHMAIHLAECLEKLGLVRSWWTFPLERLMGQVLKSTSNNHLGGFSLPLSSSAN
jgi:hypothetical protein